MKSNIWPIAGAFWSVLTVPATAVTGSVSGLLLRRLRSGVAIPVLFAIGLAVAIVVGIVMANYR